MASQTAPLAAGATALPRATWRSWAKAAEADLVRLSASGAALRSDVRRLPRCLSFTTKSMSEAIAIHGAARRVALTVDAHSGH